MTTATPTVTPQWIRISQWCEATNMPRRTAHLMIERGELSAVRVGQRFYIPASELTEFFERARKAA